MSTNQGSPPPESRYSPGPSDSFVPLVPPRPTELSLGNISTPAFPSAAPSNLFPPDYDSITTPSASAVQASQASRNLEKQALRDAWREQADQLTQVHRGQVPRSRGPPSIEPSSISNSQSSGEQRERERVGLGINGAELSGYAEQRREPGRRGILPEGMDVREALKKCQDPKLGWSLQFWVTIADPVVRPLSIK